MTDGWAWTGSDEVAVSVSVCRWCGSRVLVLQFFFWQGFVLFLSLVYRFWRFWDGDQGRLTSILGAGGSLAG